MSWHRDASSLACGNPVQCATIPSTFEACFEMKLGRFRAPPRAHEHALGTCEGQGLRSRAVGSDIQTFFHARRVESARLGDQAIFGIFFAMASTEGYNIVTGRERR